MLSSTAHFACFFALGYSIPVLRKTFGDSCLLVRSCRYKQGHSEKALERQSQLPLYMPTVRLGAVELLALVFPATDDSLTRQTAKTGCDDCPTTVMLIIVPIDNDPVVCRAQFVFPSCI